MNRLLAVLVGIAILFSCAALADASVGVDGDNFADYQGDPFEGFEIEFGSGDASVAEEDPFADFADDSGSGEEYDPFADFAASDEGDAQDPFASEAPPAAEETPAPDAELIGQMTLPLPDQTLQLTFDPSQEYSVVENHLVEAAFYTYDNPNSILYELFLIFPDDVTEGQTITPEYAMQHAVDTAIGLFVSTREQDTYFVASQQSTTGPYPETSTYSLSFSHISRGVNTTTYEGTFSAKLVSISAITGEVDKMLEVTDAAFSFTIANDQSAPSSDEAPSEDPFGEYEAVPEVTPTPAPDYRKV